MDQPNRAELSRDQIFDILSNVRRRYVLFYLSQSGEPITLQDLSRRLASWENDIPMDEVSKQQEKRVYVSLYQTHVPKLEEAGIIDYADDGTIRLTNRASEVTAYLEDARTEYPWSLYFLVLSAIGSLTLVAVAADVPVFASIPDLVASAIVVGAFLALSVAYYLYRDSGVPDPMQQLRRNG